MTFATKSYFLLNVPYASAETEFLIVLFFPAFIKSAFDGNSNTSSSSSSESVSVCTSSSSLAKFDSPPSIFYPLFYNQLTIKLTT